MGTKEYVKLHREVASGYGDLTQALIEEPPSTYPLNQALGGGRNRGDSNELH